MPITAASNGCGPGRGAPCCGPWSWHTEVVKAAVWQRTPGTWPREAEAGVAVAWAPRGAKQYCVSFPSIFFLPFRPAP